MALLVGDKVKFLNARGGGIVSKIMDTRTVSVLVEDGFEIPTLISELIRIEPNDAGSRFFEEHFDVSIPEMKKEPEPETLADDRMKPLPPFLSQNRHTEDIYLAYIPHDQKWLVTGLVDVCLVNHSTFDVLYNIYSRNAVGHFEGLDYGSLFPDSCLLLSTVNRENLMPWTEGYLQFLFHKQQSIKVLPPFNSEFKIDGMKFMKEGNYRDNALIRAKGIVVKVVSLNKYLNDQPPQILKPPEKTPADAIESNEVIFKYQVSPRIAEVDLHIHELVEDPSNLEKSEILEFQKQFFVKCLESAIVNHFVKVTFIHGVGNGSLRNSLVELLKNQKGVEFFDAPMAKFGVGAIEVRIPHNL